MVKIMRWFYIDATCISYAMEQIMNKVAKVTGIAVSILKNGCNVNTREKGHPWIGNTNDVKVPLDVSILRHMKGYMRLSPLRKVSIRALVKTLSADELYFLKEQFSLLEPSKNGSISMENIKAVDSMKESRIHDFLTSLNARQYRRMEFDEFCAAALSVYQLEAHDRWEEHARSAYEVFDKDGNRAIMIKELASLHILLYWIDNHHLLDTQQWMQSPLEIHSGCSRPSRFTNVVSWLLI